MSNRIEHSGMVECVEGRNVKVRILQTSACAACKVSSHCNASEAKEKVVDVWCDNSASYVPGQQVVVCASRQVANRALLLGFGLPLVILVGALVVFSWLGADEGLAALLSIGMLVPYYLALWLMRSSVSRRVSFYLE